MPNDPLLQLFPVTDSKASTVFKSSPKPQCKDQVTCEELKLNFFFQSLVGTERYVREGSTEAGLTLVSVPFLFLEHRPASPVRRNPSRSSPQGQVSKRASKINK